MCGIAGFTFPAGPESPREAQGGRLARMVASLRHRGPDAQRGLLLDGVALGHARLAVVDLAGGAQPMRDPETGVALVFNGEIFNHVELRRQLDGYPFRTRSDTEVLLAAFLTWGIESVRRFVGQFAFAVWDPRDRSLWLARDPVGIAPLVYALEEAAIAFASEAKALFSGGFRRAAIDPRGLAQSLTLWAPVAPTTSFAGVQALPPACWARWDGARLDVRPYWEPDFDAVEPVDDATAARQVAELLDDAVRLRLRADVPVGAYLSGGLDSSLLCSHAQEQLGGSLRTFSIASGDQKLDERRHQEEVVAALRTEHRAVEIAAREIGELLPAAVDHAEQAIVRTAPAPMLRLSRLVHDEGLRVVLTGEGADEIFWGYDLFREAKVRDAWARRPRSGRWRLLLPALHPSLPHAAQPAAILAEVYGAGLSDPDQPAFSHLVRWSASGRLLRFLSASVAEAVAAEDPIVSALGALSERSRRTRLLARAQMLEMRTLLPGYLLGAQGDRMLMAASVEGRYPYLDHRLIEPAARLPDRVKLRAMREKRVLRQCARGRLPASILARPKFPYRAPIAWVLAGPEAPCWAAELLSPDAVRAAGLFDAAKVSRLVEKARAVGSALSEADAMALVSIATSQLLWAGFVQSMPRPADVAPVSLEAA